MKKQTILILILLALRSVSFAQATSTTIEASPVPAPITQQPQTQPKSEKSAVVDQTKNLKARDHVLSFDYKQIDSDINGNSGGIESPTTKNRVKTAEVELGRNFGYFQTTLLLSGLIESLDDGTGNTERTKSSSIGLGVRYNFIQNVPGNDVIPYVKLDINALTVNSSNDVSSPMNLTGTLSQAGLGVEWFPFSQIFAVDFKLYQSKDGLKAKYKGVPVDISSETTGSSIGFNLYF
jgi:hypothetical protein